MSETAEVPTVGRFKRPGWKDGRLIFGLLLILASVAGIVALISALERTEPMLVPTTNITVGEELDASKFKVVEARLDDLSDAYLMTNHSFEDGARAGTLLRAGELVPVHAVMKTDGSGAKPVTIDLDHTLPQAVTPGSRVDVWSAAKNGPGNTYEVPELLLDSSEVTAVRAAEGNFSSSTKATLEVMVPDSVLQDLLEALANDSRLTVIHDTTGANS